MSYHFLAANNLGVFSGAIEATQVEKSWLTVQSENLIQSSKTSPPDNIIRDYNILLTKLNSFLSWTDTGSGWVGDPYSDSQSIRGNLASANRNALSRKATAAGQPAPAQVSTAPVKPVSVAVETVKNIPTEVKNIPTNVKTWIANSANYLKTSIMSSAKEMVQKYVILGIVAVLGIGAAIFAIKKMRTSPKTTTPGQTPAQTPVAATGARKKKRKAKCS